MNKVLENEPNWSFQYLIFPHFYFIFGVIWKKNL
jgi:hypothetical protein